MAVDTLEKLFEYKNNTNINKILENRLINNKTWNKIKSELDAAWDKFDDKITFDEMKGTDYYKLIKTKHKVKLKRKVYDEVMLYNERFPRFGSNYAMWRKLMKTGGYDIDISKYIVSHKALSEITLQVKKSGPKCFSDDRLWTLVSGVDTMYGQVKIEMTTDEVVDKVRAWTDNSFKPNFNGSTQEFLQKFREETAAILRYKDTTIQTDETKEDYIQKIPATSTQGSGYNPDGTQSDYKIYYDGQEAKYTKTKFTVSCGLSEKEKMDKLLSEKSSYCNISVKTNEVYPKKRMLAGSDYKTFLKMNYVKRWLYRWLKGEGSSTLWMDRRQKLEMFRRLSKVEDDEIAVPIDQTAFDHHYVKEMFIIQMEEIANLIRDVEQNEKVRDDLLLVIEKMITSVCKTIIRVRDNENGKTIELPWNTGLLSGWGLTAELNTLKNIAEMRIAKRLLQEKYNYNLNIKLFNAQGDDQLVRTGNIFDAFSYYLAMVSNGAEINFRKNFFSYNHDEYLRITGSNKRIVGYLPRLMDNFMWQSNIVKLSTIQKFNELAGNWKRIGLRLYLGMNNDIKKLMYNDAINAGINREIVYNQINNPRTFGGIGDDYSDKVFVTYESTPLALHGRVEYEGDGLRQFEQRYLRNQYSGLKSWLLSNTDFISDVKYEEIDYFENRLKVRKIPMLISENVRLDKPDFNDGWDQSVIINVNDKVMHEAFKDIDEVFARYGASKKFIYSWLTGQLKIPTPNISTISDDIIGLYCHNYNNSLIYAHLMKRNKNKDNPWFGMCLFFESELNKMVTNAFRGYYFGN